MLWKIYFFFFSVLCLADIALRVLVANFQPMWMSLFFYYILPISISIIGLYGFVYSKKILNSLFWKVFFGFSVIYGVIGVVGDLRTSKEFDATSFNLANELIWGVGFLLLQLPFFIAIFQYAFNKRYWDNN